MIIKGKNIDDMKKLLDKVYKNKSTDEYKCKGDIKKSPNYDLIEDRVNKFIPSIKGYPTNNVTILQNSLKELKKPIWGKMVSEYMAKPDDTNTVYAALFVSTYRTLLGEVMAAITCSEATDNGFVYNPGKIDRNSQDPMKFLKKMATNSDSYIKEILNDVKKQTKGKSEEKIQQEAATVSGIGGAIEGVATIADATFGAIGRVFKSALALNPISFFSALFSRAYDKKVDKFKKFDDLYQATVDAYNEYRKLPQSKRKARIEHRYIKMMEKYNIKRENLRKQLEHYDRRAHEGDMYDDDDDDNDVKETKTSSSSKKHEDKNNKNDESKTPQAASTVNTSDNTDDEDKKPASDDFDF